MAVAAKAVETKASFGHTRSIEVCVGVASPNRIAHDNQRRLSLVIPVGKLTMFQAARCSFPHGMASVLFIDVIAGNLDCIFATLAFEVAGQMGLRSSRCV